MIFSSRLLSFTRFLWMRIVYKFSGEPRLYSIQVPQFKLLGNVGKFGKRQSSLVEITNKYRLGHVGFFHGKNKQQIY